jgi:UDP-N-acetylmuramoyl-tripeptide--D-alanyl-D-alanine ligase
MSSRTKAKVVLFGESPSAAVRATEVSIDDRGRASYRLNGQPVRLAVAGAHQVGNTLAAAAAALELGLPLADVADALGEVGITSSRRMDVFDRPDGVTVIDDTYNANPASTAAALRALATIGAGRRTIAVLGYMAELGAHERDGHEEVGRLAAELGVDRLIAVSPADPILAGYGGGELAPDQAAAIALLGDLREGDVVLVKGSRYRTWDVVDALRPEGVRP